MVDIFTVNAMNEETFIDTFGGVLEDSPQLAAAVAARRPFTGPATLAAAFADEVRDLDLENAVALLRAHPELGARRPMAVASVAEQASAGLPDAAADLQARLAAGNAAYRERFGFPFILAVRGSTPEEIADVLDARVGNDAGTELATALAEVCTIARLRVEQLVDEP